MDGCCVVILDWEVERVWKGLMGRCERCSRESTGLHRHSTFEVLGLNGEEWDVGFFSGFEALKRKGQKKQTNSHRMGYRITSNQASNR